MTEELPSAWCRTKLVEIVDILDSQRVPANNKERQKRLARATKTFPYYGATGQVGEIDDFIFDGEAVLLGEDGAPFLEPYKAKAYRVSGKYWVNNHAHILRGNGALDNGFLCHQLNVLDYRRYVSGTTRLKLTQASLKELPVKLPPLSEQRRIVEKIETLFARLDKGEEALREVQKLLARYRQSVLKAAVTGQLTAGTTEAWKSVALGTLLEDIRYGTAKKCRPDADGIAVLRIPNVANGEIDLQDLKFTQLDERETKKLGLRKGDLLIVRSNGSANLVGRGAVVNEEAVGLAFAGYLIRLRVDQKRLLPDFLHLVLESPTVRAKIERQARSTSGVHNINSGEVKAITFDLPPVDIQADIIEHVDEHVSKMANLEAWCETELARSAALRQSVLKDAFAGRLVPQDPADEPAADLLARIKEAHAVASNRSRKRVRA